ncbi:hypothetical protein LguiB_012613 [Lonicera macranthoides]
MEEKQQPPPQPNRGKAKKERLLFEQFGSRRNRFPSYDWARGMRQGMREGMRQSQQKEQAPRRVIARPTTSPSGQNGNGV